MEEHMLQMVEKLKLNFCGVSVGCFVLFCFEGRMV